MKESLSDIKNKSFKELKKKKKKKKAKILKITNDCEKHSWRKFCITFIHKIEPNLRNLSNKKTKKCIKTTFSVVFNETSSSVNLECHLSNKISNCIPCYSKIQWTGRERKN